MESRDGRLHIPANDEDDFNVIDPAEIEEYERSVTSHQGEEVAPPSSFRESAASALLTEFRIAHPGADTGCLVRSLSRQVGSSLEPRPAGMMGRSLLSAADEGFARPPAEGGIRAAVGGGVPPGYNNSLWAPEVPTMDDPVRGWRWPFSNENQTAATGLGYGDFPPPYPAVQPWQFEDERQYAFAPHQGTPTPAEHHGQRQYPLVVALPTTPAHTTFAEARRPSFSPLSDTAEPSAASLNPARHPNTALTRGQPWTQQQRDWLFDFHSTSRPHRWRITQQAFNDQFRAELQGNRTTAALREEFFRECRRRGLPSRSYQPRRGRARGI